MGFIYINTSIEPASPNAILPLITFLFMVFIPLTNTYHLTSMDKIFNLPLTLLQDLESERVVMDGVIGDTPPMGKQSLVTTSQESSYEGTSSAPTSQLDSCADSSSSLNVLGRSTRGFYRVKEAQTAEMAEFVFF